MGSPPRAVHILTAGLFALGVGTGVLARGPVGDWWLLVPLGVALVIGETLQVQFKYGRDVRAVDVFEAVLAPVLLTFAGPAAVGLAVTSKAISQHRLGIPRTKALFNVAQWAAAVGVASLVYRSLAGDDAGETTTLGALVAALLAFAVVNEIAMAWVLRIVNQVSTAQVLRDLVPEYAPHALMWCVNAALGVLFAVAVAEVPATAFLVLAPLAFLRWSHQAYLSLRADRSRLDGLARAVSHLAVPIDPQEALPTFLDDVRESFASTTVELVRFDPPTLVRSGGHWATAEQSIDAARLLVAGGDVRRARATGKDAPLAAALLAAGHRDALAAPLVRDGRTIGALVSYDGTGHEGFEEGEEAVMVALAAVATRAIEKSELLGEIVEERRELAEIVDRSSDGIFTIGRDGTVESWNPAMATMTGVAPKGIVGSLGIVQFAPRDAQGNPVRFDRWAEEPIPVELLISTTSGERWLGCSSAESRDDLLIVVARDITRAREIDQMKDDFIATVSHELRTPLATIRGFTDVLEPPNQLSDELLRQVLGRIRKGTHRLERLVANLLEVSRIEARGTVEQAPTALDLVDVVRRIVDEVQESWPDRVLEVDLGGGSWRVQGNLLSLERILINLLSNALTYSDGGPVRLAVRTEDEDRIAVSVSDEGPGIAPADQARIFDRFERVDTPDQKAGTGLGLYIARGLATSMGAELDVQSTPGHGATFTLHLRNTAAHRPGVADLVW